MKTRHLVLRALTSWSNRGPQDDGLRIAADCLLPGELSLWSAMQPRDQSHSLQVLSRFDAMAPHASRPERAAALLHDVGKTVSSLGWWGRIAATLVGPRGRRFAHYHDHESIGAAMLAGVSDPRTVSLVGGGVEDDIGRALAAADDI